MLEMLFKALGLDDAAVAELKSLLDPAKINAAIAAAKLEYAARVEQLDRIERAIEDLKTRQGMAELVAHGATAMHPNFQKNLDDQLTAAAERGEIAFVVEVETAREEAVAANDETPRPLVNYFALEHIENERRDSNDTAERGSDDNGSGSGG